MGSSGSRWVAVFVRIGLLLASSAASAAATQYGAQNPAADSAALLSRAASAWHGSPHTTNRERPAQPAHAIRLDAAAEQGPPFRMRSSGAAAEGGGEPAAEPPPAAEPTRLQAVMAISIVFAMLGAVAGALGALVLGTGAEHALHIPPYVRSLFASKAPSSGAGARAESARGGPSSVRVPIEGRVLEILVDGDLCVALTDEGKVFSWPLHEHFGRSPRRSSSWRGSPMAVAMGVAACKQRAQQPGPASPARAALGACEEALFTSAYALSVAKPQLPGTPSARLPAALPQLTAEALRLRGCAAGQPTSPAGAGPVEPAVRLTAEALDALSDAGGPSLSSTRHSTPTKASAYALRGSSGSLLPPALLAAEPPTTLRRGSMCGQAGRRAEASGTPGRSPVVAGGTRAADGTAGGGAARNSLGRAIMGLDGSPSRGLLSELAQSGGGTSTPQSPPASRRERSSTSRSEEGEPSDVSASSLQC